MNTPTVKIKRLSRAAIVPRYATAGSAAFDLHACIESRVGLLAGESVMIPTGLAMAIPDGYVGLIAPRSGVGAKHGIVLGNLVGVIDADYRGEIMVSLWNRNHSPGHSGYVVNPGDRIAQMVILPVAQASLLDVQELPDTERGSGGFGSTGH